MKIRNGQSKQQITQKHSHSLSFNHQNLLNQMYDRVCNHQSTNQEYSNIQTLLSYLSISGQNSQVEEKAASPHFDPNFVPIYSQDQDKTYSIHYPKKYSMQQRIKTDMHQRDGSANGEIQSLKLQNELLRKKLIKCQKKIIRLESFYSEVEYLKKLSLLQHAEIEKLRIMLRNVQIEQVENTIENFRSIESQPMSLKEKKYDKNAVVISTQSNTSIQNLQKKKPRCSHKQTLRRKDKQNQGAYRTHSVFYQTKNKQTIDKNRKGVSIQQKSIKLKNRKAIARLD